jgi:hypothetical protein
MAMPKGIRGPRENLKGKKYGKLTILEWTKPKGHDYFWLCQCDCGKKVEIGQYSFKSGHTKSCGCLEIETRRKGHKPGEAGLKRAYSIYRLHALKAGRVFELTKEDFREITKQNCYYCGDKPTRKVNLNPLNPTDEYSTFVLTGIDRVDNAKGYTKDNVVSCCTICNMMKTDKSLQVFVDQCKKITENLQGVNHESLRNQMCSQYQRC